MEGEKKDTHTWVHTCCAVKKSAPSVPHQCLVDDDERLAWLDERWLRPRTCPLVLLPPMSMDAARYGDGLVLLVLPEWDCRCRECCARRCEPLLNAGDDNDEEEEAIEGECKVLPLPPQGVAEEAAARRGDGLWGASAGSYLATHWRMCLP